MVRLDCGVVAVKRAVDGVVMVVVIVVVASGKRSAVRCLLGVATMGRMLAFVTVAVDREGVRPRRSKIPRTRPSLCGVGLMDVGAAARGVKDVRFEDGVPTWAAEGVRVAAGMSSGWDCWVFCNAWSGLDLLEGVCGAKAASD